MKNLPKTSRVRLKNLVYNNSVTEPSLLWTPQNKVVQPLRWRNTTEYTVVIFCLYSQCPFVTYFKCTTSRSPGDEDSSVQEASGLGVGEGSDTCLFSRLTVCMWLTERTYFTTTGHKIPRVRYARPPPWEQPLRFPGVNNVSDPLSTGLHPYFLPGHRTTSVPSVVASRPELGRRPPEVVTSLPSL